MYVQLGASKPVSSLLTTISSLRFAGSSMNCRFASSSYCFVVWPFFRTYFVYVSNL